MRGKVGRVRSGRLVALAGILVALVVGTALAQPAAGGRTADERPGLSLRDRPTPDDPPIEPRRVDPDPDAERIRAFHEGLSGITEGTQRRMRLERARRIAPFDLGWGVR